MQLRVNLERMSVDGDAVPSGGVLSAYEPPGGPGVRVDGHGYGGLATNSSFDSLLAKLVCHASNGLDDAIARARRALRGFRIEGVETNMAYLHALLDLPEVATGCTGTPLLPPVSSRRQH